jgi:hypothetical protein
MSSTRRTRVCREASGTERELKEGKGFEGLLFFTLSFLNTDIWLFSELLALSLTYCNGITRIIP